MATITKEYLNKILDSTDFISAHVHIITYVIRPVVKSYPIPTEIVRCGVYGHSEKYDNITSFGGASKRADIARVRGVPVATIETTEENSETVREIITHEFEEETHHAVMSMETLFKYLEDPTITTPIIRETPDGARVTFYVDTTANDRYDLIIDMNGVNDIFHKRRNDPSTAPTPQHKENDYLVAVPFDEVIDVIKSQTDNSPIIVKCIHGTAYRLRDVVIPSLKMFADLLKN